MRLIHLRAPGLLGLLDRELGVAEQFFRVVARSHQGDSDRAFDADFEFAELERGGHYLLNPFGGAKGVLDAAAKRYQHAEFVAARPCQNVASAKREDQPTREGDE